MHELQYTLRIVYAEDLVVSEYSDRLQ